MNIFDFPAEITELAHKAQNKAIDEYIAIQRSAELNQLRVLKAFTYNRVSTADFNPTTGYGYDDLGREVLDRLTADIFGTEDALIRYNFASGTHTLSVMLFGILRPGDTVLCLTGTPYDTIRSTFGLGDSENIGSLRDFGVNYRQVDLLPDGNVDIDGITKALKSQKIKAVYIQRSKGYSLRPSLTVSAIARISKAVREVSDAIIMLDNCYCEFVEYDYSPASSVDIMAGSLIKNAGGGIARCGGYIAGKENLVKQCSYRLTAPGIGREIGATLGNNRELFMGLFNAPHVVGEALKTAVFTAALFEEMGYEAFPKLNEKRADIVQSIVLGNRERLIAFCKGLQSGSPIDSFVTPEPAPMPGYDSDVIMAAGAFTSGSSIELSADAPLCKPYAVWLQGGLNYHSAKAAVMLAAQKVLECEK